MDSYFFLHSDSLSNINYQAYKAGLMALNMLAVEMSADEKRFKHESVYDNPLYCQLLIDYAETSALITFIEQCSTIEQNISDDAMFGAAYPNKDAGFLGIIFNGITGIAPYRMVVNTANLIVCRKKFLERLIKTGQDEELAYLLWRRYPKFDFSKEATDDILWWKHNNKDIVDNLIELLDDIPEHPFTGGLGKTEVLSNTKNQVVSKRITQKDRLTYTYGEITQIHRCKEHY